MARDIPEADWKLLSKLKPLALDRLCRRILDEIGAVAADSKSSHERYLAIYTLVQKSDEEVADVFNELRRSNALFRLVAMRSRGLISDEEYFRFSGETQAIISLLTG